MDKPKVDRSKLTQAREEARKESAEYIAQNMQAAKSLRGRPHVLLDALGRITVDGLYLEFGVAAGTSINFVAPKVTAKVYGFDSFDGLPEDWLPGAPKGQFKQESLPQVPENVELVVGLFDDTLPAFLQQHPGPIAFLHIDCDIYSSTKTIFELCHDRIVPGTVIVFDEYFNYPGWRDHEFKAFHEFLKASNRKYVYAAMAPERFQASVVITE